MHLDHEVHLRAHRRADALEDAQTFLDLGVGDAHPAVGEGCAVEGPDLHAGDALGQKIAREALGFVLEGVQVVERLQRTVAPEPGVDILRARLLHIVRAGAGVVDADGVAGAPAEQGMQGQPGVLAQAVPQRHVECRGGAHLGAGRRVADRVTRELAVDGADAGGVAAEHQRRDDFMQEGVDRAGREEGLAQAGDPRVRLDDQPQQVVVVAGADRFERGNVHASAAVGGCSK